MAIEIVYDDQCPFCRNYCQLLRLRETAGNVELIDARKPSKIMNEITARGLDIDHGMVVKINDQLHYGSQAIHILALLSSRSNFFNRITYWIFKSEKRANILYPALKNCRNLALKIMGIPLINNLQKSDPATK
jgi:predicted DCC family thiol-disulfide oxidoreductase YuxK